MKKITIIFLSVIILTIAFVVGAYYGSRIKPNSGDNIVNHEDNSPPIIKWTVLNKRTNQTSTVTGSGTVTAKHGDDLLITDCIIDDGGVKELTSSSTISYSCADGNIGQNIGPSLGALQTIPLGKDASGKAWTNYCSSFTLNTNTLSCNQGWTYKRGGWAFFVSGKNLSNLSGSGTLSIDVIP